MIFYEIEICHFVNSELYAKFNVRAIGLDHTKYQHVLENERMNDEPRNTYLI